MTEILKERYLHAAEMYDLEPGMEGFAESFRCLAEEAQSDDGH